MDDEKIRIMNMVKDGTITPSEGLELLEALASNSRKALGFTTTLKPIAACCSGESRSEEQTDSGPTRKPRWLHIKVIDEEDKKSVNIKVPISLAKFMGKFIPKEAKEEMTEQGIDLDLKGLMEAIEQEGAMEIVNCCGEGGKMVKIYTE